MQRLQIMARTNCLNSLNNRDDNFITVELTMRSCLLAMTLVSFVVAADPKAHPIAFDKADLGKLPAGWTAAKTGEGEGSVWKVTADDSAPGKPGHVLTQTAAGPNRLYNLCVRDESSFLDGDLTVRVKAIAGEIDQGGGLVWRYLDANNYYVCRYNPLEKNFRLYTVKEGKRKELASKEKIELKKAKEFAVSVKHIGSKIVCELDGEHKLEVTDETFPKPGKVGLWTKADAVTSFDKLGIHSKPF